MDKPATRLPSRRLALLGALTGVLMSACTDHPGRAGATGAVPTTAGAAAPGAAAGEETGGGQAPGGEGPGGAAGSATAPGAALVVGETATLPVEPAEGGRGLVLVTVVSVEEGDPVGAVDGSGPDGGRAPWHVTYALTKVSGDGLEGTRPESGAAALLGDGSRVPAEADATGPCTPEPAPAGFDDGRSYETCRTYLVPRGSPLTGVAYAGAPGAPYRESPVTWSVD